MPQIMGIWGFSSDRIRLFFPVELKGVFYGYLIWQALHQLNKKAWNQAHVYSTEIDQFFKLCSCRKYTYSPTEGMRISGGGVGVL